MIKSTTEILKEVLDDTDDLIDYVLSSSGDPNLPKWLLELKEKISVAYGRQLDDYLERKLGFTKKGN